MKINLLYDMTRIIQAWNNDNLKRGVYTVCYNLFKELIKRNEIDLYFYCHRNYNDALKTFLQNNFPEVAEKIIINDNSSPFLKKINAFFSPQHKIPDFIEERPDICKFLFIHDVMPLVIPGLEKDLEKGSWIGEVIRSINSTDYYFTNSECSKRDIINYVKEASSDHIKVIPLGVADNFHPCKDEAKILSIKKKYNIPRNKKYLFSLCALDDRKNLLMQVSAFFELIKVNKIHDLVYVLGGSGADDFLEKLKSTLTAKDFQKFKDKILKIGYVADKDLASLYSGAEWFTFTSKYEGFGLPVLEAMACGCPVITSNNSSLPEVIGDAGMMLLNLKKMRNENISEKLIDYKLHKDQGFFMSQDALNCTFAERVILLSPTYNYIKKSWDLFDINKICEFYNITQEECDKIQKKSLILHLADKSKPWKTAHTWGSNLWKNYYLLSPLKNKKFFYVDDKKYMLREDYSKKIKIISIDCNQSTKTVKLFNMFPVFHETTRIWNNGDFKIKKYFLGIRFYSKLTAIRPNIVLVYDFPDWIIGRWAQQIKRVLKDKYNFILTTFYQVKDSPEYYKELFKKVDVVHLLVAYPYEYYKTLTDRTKILPTIHHWLDYDKQIKGIATDCCQIVTGSSQWKKSMIKNGISPYKVDVIFSGIEDRFLQEHKPLYRKNKKIINIGFFAKASSNNEDRKGTRHFMALLNEIKQQNKQKLFHIYLTGAGWEQFVKQIKKEEFKVTYIPFVSDEDMPRLYKTLDFYLMLSDVEGGPVTVIEAMASKTPVLATNIGVVQDIGEDKKNIILIDNKNSKDILQKILYYKEHQTELDDIINNAYKTAQNMTYDKTFAPLEQVYNKFLYGRKLTGALLDFDTLNKHFMRKAYSVQDEKKQRNYVPWKLFGLSRNTEICKFYFFGIPIFSSRQGTKKNGDIKLKHYFCGLPYFVKEKANFKKIYKFLGLSRTKYKNILRKTFSFSKQSLTSSDIKGLSKPEKWGRWSDGKTVDMKIKLPTDKGDLRCCFVLKPFLNEKIKQQIVSVSINDKFIVDWIFELGKPSPKTEFIIPKSLLKKSGKTFFSFKIKNPVSPWELGLAEDRRNLGIGFISLQITPAIVKETSLQKWWKKVKAKILPKPPVDYAPAFQALSKELIGLKGLVESLQKEIKTLENEQVMTQKMLVDEKTLLQKKRRF